MRAAIRPFGRFLDAGPPRNVRNVDLWQVPVYPRELMRKPHKVRDWPLGLCLSLLAGMSASAQPTDGPRGILGWTDSPYRSFGPAHRVSDTALVLDEQDDGYLREALGAELSRLSADLFDRQGWPSPFRTEDPLRIYVSRGAGDGVRRLAARTVVERHLVSPAIQIDAVGLTDDQVVREVGRLVALAAISSYGVADSSFLTTAAAELLSAPPEEDREATRAVAASPSVRLSDHARTMGRGFLEEFLREAGGAPALRLIWERSSERGSRLSRVSRRSSRNAPERRRKISSSASRRVSIRHSRRSPVLLGSASSTSRRARSTRRRPKFGPSAIGRFFRPRPRGLFA